MRFGHPAIVAAALLITSIEAQAVPVSFQFEAAPGLFGRSGPAQEFPPPPLPEALNALANQPISGSFTFDTARPSVPGYLPFGGELLEVGATYLNPVLNFDLQIGSQLLSFTTASPPSGVSESSITITDLPAQMANAFPGDFYRVSAAMGTGLISGFDSYRVAASIMMTESDLTRVMGYDPLQPLLLADAPWNFSFSLFDPKTDISYSLFTPVTRLQQVGTTEVPEPSTSALLGIGLLFCFAQARRRRVLASSFLG